MRRIPGHTRRLARLPAPPPLCMLPYAVSRISLPMWMSSPPPPARAPGCRTWRPGSTSARRRPPGFRRPSAARGCAGSGAWRCRGPRPGAASRPRSAPGPRSRDTRDCESTDIECCDSGSRPPCCAATATPARVCVWSTHLASCRPSWIALWMMKPAAFTGNGESSSFWPSRPIFTRLEAEISSKNTPYGLMRNWSSVPGHAKRDVREDEVLPAEHRARAIARGQVDARRPFFRRDLVLERGNVEGCGLHRLFSSHRLYKRDTFSHVIFRRTLSEKPLRFFSRMRRDSGHRQSGCG